MNFPSWDPQQTQFILGENYILERADPTVFAIHFTTAELAHNVWFRQSWDNWWVVLPLKTSVSGSHTTSNGSAVSASNQT